MKRYLSAFIIILSIALSSCGPTEVVVRERPVAPVYVRPIAPAPSYIWIEGGWVRSRGTYKYRQGYWAAPRHHSRPYKPGYWRNTRRGWVWVPGRW